MSEWRRWTIDDVPSQDGRVAIVTGGNSGLGWWIARELAAKGARVVLGCRSGARAEAAIAALRSSVPAANVAWLPLDLGDLGSIASFAERLSAHSPIDLLINNAGVMALPQSRTVNGFESQIGINHLGHFALTLSLLDRLQGSDAPRIVTVASQAHTWASGLDVDDLNGDRRPYDRWDTYSRSKLANLLFAFELQRRLKQSGHPAIALAAHPGFADTELGNVAFGEGEPWLHRLAFRFASRVFAQPARQGSWPALCAATDPRAQGGDYIGPDGWRQMRGSPTPVRSRSLARDGDLAARLWKASETLTGLHWPPSAAA